MSIKAKGLQSTKRWLQGANSKIRKSIQEEIVGAGALAVAELRAKNAVLSAVYAAYSPRDYDRTFELLDSVGAVAIQQEPPTAGIVISLGDDGRAIRPPGDVHYARFFLPAEYGSAANSANSFVSASAVPERDFLAVWIQVFGDLIPREVAEALLGGLRA
ncbi:MAG: hypothetical protein HS116_25090 [Planctomycetes bacterium]|nr:hypothetical protein [Planctomycetota bacterium]